MINEQRQYDFYVIPEGGWLVFCILHIVDVGAFEEKSCSRKEQPSPPHSCLILTWYHYITYLKFYHGGHQIVELLFCVEHWTREVLCHFCIAFPAHHLLFCLHRWLRRHSEHLSAIFISVILLTPPPMQWWLHLICLPLSTVSPSNRVNQTDSNPKSSHLCCPWRPLLTWQFWRIYVRNTVQWPFPHWGA